MLGRTKRKIGGRGDSGRSRRSFYCRCDFVYEGRFACHRGIVSNQTIDRVGLNLWMFACMSILGLLCMFMDVAKSVVIFSTNFHV